jgi:hypothetical protein
MALEPEEKRTAAMHLRALRLDLPELFLAADDDAVDTALDALSDNRVYDVHVLLPRLDTMRESMLAISSRFKAKRVGGTETNDKEWGDRLQQYQYFCGQLGATCGVTKPLANYGVSSGVSRGWEDL